MRRAMSTAGPRGTDSMDLLVAAMESRGGTNAVRQLGFDRDPVLAAARAWDGPRVGSPGLTADAKVVIENVSAQTLSTGAAPGVRELLAALASVDCPASELLASRGMRDALAGNGLKPTRPAN
jgi:hypothetical protein